MTTTDLLAATIRSIQALNPEAIDRMADALARVRNGGGRAFVIGNGGGAGHASHAVCDLRKLCNLEAYCPTDNASELTARVNDDDWPTTYLKWLQGSRFNSHDALLIISVGGGSLEPPVSENLVYAMDHANQLDAITLAIVGRDGGFTGKYSDVTVLIPCDTPELVTFVVEGVQAVILHALVSKLAVKKAKWESVDEGDISR